MFEERWGVEMKRERGLKLPEMLDAAIDGRSRRCGSCGYDIAQSDPDIDHVDEALSNLEFLVVQEIFENETSKFAHVILPAASFLEKTGTFTNAERRIQLVCKAADAARRREDRSRDLRSHLRRGSGTSCRTTDPRT